MVSPGPTSWHLSLGTRTRKSKCDSNSRHKPGGPIINPSADRVSLFPPPHSHFFFSPLFRLQLVYERYGYSHEKSRELSRASHRALDRDASGPRPSRSALTVPAMSKKYSRLLGAHPADWQALESGTTAALARAKRKKKKKAKAPEEEEAKRGRLSNRASRSVVEDAQLWAQERAAALKASRDAKARR